MTIPNQQTRTSPKGIALIQDFESCKLQAYQDVALVWTIGWGNTQYENGISVKAGDKITQKRADQLFLTILSRFETGVHARIRTTLHENQFSALVSLAYNIGFRNFDQSTLLKKVNTNPNDVSIRNEFIKYNKAKGKVKTGLTRRRTKEADLYFSN